MALYIGSNKKRVALGGLSVLFATYDIVTGITVTTPPTKTEYKNGEAFDPTGMVVTATYSNGTTKEIANYKIINGDQLSSDMTTVVISYTERGTTVTTTYEVEVAPSLATVNISTQGTASVMITAGALGISVSGVDISSSLALISTYPAKIGSNLVITPNAGQVIMVAINGADGFTHGTQPYTYVVESNVNVVIGGSGNAILVSIVEVSDATATITLNGSGDASDCYITYNGAKYYNATATPSFEANIGGIIYCFADKGYDKPVIKLNGNTVVQGEDDIEYAYTVHSNATIALEATSNRNRIFITDEGAPSTAILTLNTSDTKMTNVIINGTEYSTSTTMEVPVGTVVSCGVETEDDKQPGFVTVNGKQVFTNTNSYETEYYDYIVVGNATIATKYETTEKREWYGIITITESAGADEPTLISFSINESGNTTTYQAEEGMTWGEWVNSEYNDDGRSGGVKPYIVENDMIYHTEQSLSVMVSNVYTFPSPNDLIITNGVYELAKD